jgi:hypothetical protein
MWDSGQPVISENGSRYELSQRNGLTVVSACEVVDWRSAMARLRRMGLVRWVVDEEWARGQENESGKEPSTFNLKRELL